VAKVDAVFASGLSFWLLQTDVVLVLLDPVLDGMTGLPNVDLTSLAGHAVYIRSL
jgi:hypothetical protein